MSMDMEAAGKQIVQSDYGSELGPYVIGTAFDACLWGILFHQTVHWVIYSKQEKLYVKLLVAWNFLAATGMTTFAMALMFHVFVYAFATYSYFVEATVWWAWLAMFNVMAGLPSQIFYLERAYRLHHNALWIPIIIIPCMIMSLIGYLGVTIVSQMDHDFQQFNAHGGVFFYLAVTTTLAMDLILTGSIIWGLVASRTGWSQTDRLVTKLLKISLEAQLPPTLLALTFLILYIVIPASPMMIFFDYILPKAYSCALLAVLNSRLALRREADQENRTYIMSATYNPRSQPAAFKLDQIRIQTQTFQETSPATLEVEDTRPTPTPPSITGDQYSDDDNKSGNGPEGSEIALTDFTKV